MIPPRSPFGLIQEDLWPDAWKILLACMFLNCTSRKQAQKVLPTLFKKWPSPEELIACDRQDLIDTIRPLGFANRRSENIIKMSREYISGLWKDVRELPGIGEYAGAAYDIFCKGKLPEAPPTDGALVRYYEWRKLHEERQEACTANQEG